MMAGAMGCFVVNDALTKYVSQSVPSAQLIFLRGTMTVAMVLLLARQQGATRRLRDALHPPVLWRSMADACGTVMYLFSLFHLPLGNATAINLAAPLFMTAFAVLFLRERASAVRWACLVLGFAGVLCVVQPAGDGFNAWALLCLAGTLLHALRDLLTRRLDPAIPSLLIALSTALALTLLAGLLSLLEGWQPIAWRDLGLLALAAGFLVAAYLLLIRCLRLGEISLTAPFRYSALLYAVLLGYLVWGDVPNGWAWAGIALLVASGLAMVHSERGPRTPAMPPR